MNDHVHNVVQRLRIEKGLTQEELAEKVGVSRQTIIAIEKGNYTPSVLLALKIGTCLPRISGRYFLTMNTRIIVQTSILVVLAIILFTLVDPFMYWMPNMVQMIGLTVAAALLAVFAGFVIAEEAEDERDVVHRMHAGRAGFLAGIGVLTVALVYQGFTHTLDIWIPVALIAMVAAKLVVRWQSERVN